MLIYKINEEEQRFANWKDFHLLKDVSKSSLNRAVKSLQEVKIVYGILSRIYERDKNTSSFRANYPGLVERKLKTTNYASKPMFATSGEYLEVMEKLSKMDLDKLLKTGI